MRSISEVAAGYHRAPDASCGWDRTDADVYQPAKGAAVFDSLVKSIESTFVQFSVRRMLYLAFLVLITGGGLLSFDRATGYTSFRRLDARITALERLRSLESAGIRQSASLTPVYDSLVARLRGLDEREPTSILLWSIEPPVKFLAATCLPLSFVAWGVVQMIRRTPGAGSMVGGALITVLVLGVAAILVPTGHSLRVTAIILFAVQVLLMIALVRYFGQRRSAPVA